MKEKKKYAKAYQNLLKSYLVVFLLSIVLCISLVKVFDNIINGNYEVLVNDIVAIVLGIFASLLTFILCKTKKDGKLYINDIEQENKVLKDALNDLKLISSMIEFNVNSKKSELEILILYKDIQLSRKSLLNNISLIGITSLYDDLSSKLLKISNKKEFIEESRDLLSTIENITKMVDELIILNNNEKDAFLKEEEYLDNLFEEKNKIK